MRACELVAECGFSGSLAQKFDELWHKLDVNCQGVLHEDQLYKMLASGGALIPSRVSTAISEHPVQLLVVHTHQLCKMLILRATSKHPMQLNRL